MATLVLRLLTSSGLVAIGFTAASLMQPEAAAQECKEILGSGVVRIENAVPTRGEWGEWKRFFRGDTYGTKDMVVLAVTLEPGQAPHPPHQHAEEEFMILANGHGTWHLDGVDLPARPSDVLYAAPWSMHGLKNTSDVPLTGQRHDSCLLDTFIAAVRFMEGEPKKPWWKYTTERKRVLAARKNAESGAERRG